MIRRFLCWHRRTKQAISAIVVSADADRRIFAQDESR